MNKKINQEPTAVTVIGLGNMGVALAEAFLKGGHPTTVWNRSANKADGLVAKGAALASTVADAVAASPVVIICLSTYEVMHEQLSPLTDELSGRVLVNLTSGTPDQARNTAIWAAEREVEYLDGAIMAVPQLIGLPETLIFYGGSKTLFEAHAPLLRVLGGNAAYLGDDHGAPLLYDLALLTMLYGSVYGYLHAHAFLSTANISPTAFLPFATNWVNHVIAPSITNPDSARALEERNYATDVSNLNTNKLGLEHIIRASKELDIPAEWLKPLHAIAAQQVAEGYGNDAFERVFEALRKS
ncbi:MULTISPECIES: NAD(P)-dependent oxidoreductase [Paenibacillus]|uniref:6-phosphogluconate dehydrogenase NAD-binding n=1 Tax=Paenibacillus lactis 154 TaxID=743719 RepID=G4HD64_9BACL|nr:MULTISPECIES: NAD(P)-binding domain-containing protein [Paenibacillus]AUD39512.1 WHU imine reductase 27 [synthetic construct]EHB65990.1 6-phosphogluconate dehydrogenase NAD-binding [Paenibacillus lactis 154]